MHPCTVFIFSPLVNVISTSLLTNGGECSQFLTQALQILGDTDPMSLAAIRTAYLLSIVLLQSNQSDAAKQMRSRVNQALEAKGKRVDAKEAGYSQSFFDSLILFRHL